jgi:putative two-component system response regulator
MDRFNMRQTLLIVDDEVANLVALDLLLSQDFKLRVARSGADAIRIANSSPPPDLILLDVVMPGMDGYAVLKQLKASPTAREIPVIFVTAREAAEDEEKGLSLGAVDYVTKPVNPAVLHARVRTHLALKRANDLLHDENDALEAEVTRRMEENQLIQDVSIRSLAYLAETRDPETGNHILRTQSYVEELAALVQHHPRFSDVIDARYIRLVTKSAPLHDIGKVGIPDHILLKPGPLTPDEWAVMKTHAEIGAGAIERATAETSQQVDFLALAKEIAHWHHERWDGTGYPDGLAGEEIPLSARLMAIADVFDALICARVYKPAFSLDKARQIIREGRGKHFDPDLAKTFLSHYEVFVDIALRHQDQTMAGATVG